MLPRAARLTRRQDFTLTVRRGRRATRGALAVHLLAPVGPADAVGPARAGFVVGRAVGGSVDRHRMVRRLRHLVRDRLGRLPDGALLVVRALPAAREADSATLGQDLDAALTRLLTAEPAAARLGRPAGCDLAVGNAAVGDAGSAAATNAVRAGSAGGASGGRGVAGGAVGVVAGAVRAGSAREALGAPDSAGRGVAAGAGAVRAGFAGCDPGGTGVVCG